MSAVIRRRTVFTGAAGAAGFVTLGAGVPPAPAGRLRIYVLVVDGCRPDEAHGPLMPTLRSLAADGTSYAAARAVPVAETIPNHVAMMSGVQADRSGVPANHVYDRARKVLRDLDRPSDLRAGTLLERLPTERGLATASVLSKEYLFGIFSGRATHQWNPFPLVPVSDHAPDVATMTAVLDIVDAHDPALLFANLGDVDRVGHSDVSGTTLAAARRLALSTTDAQLSRFVTHLRRTGRWKSSMVVVLADHSMDWSLPDRLIGLAGPLSADPLLAGNVQIAQNGGADLLYWTGDPGSRADAVQRMRRITLATPGVLTVHDPASLGLGGEAGDLVAFCRAGWRFSDPTPASNPIPGNHGHPATQPIPLIVSGGHPWLRRGAVVSAPAGPLDVAPTVAGLFGLSAPEGGWDGTSRTEALTPA